MRAAAVMGAPALVVDALYGSYACAAQASAPGGSGGSRSGGDSRDGRIAELESLVAELDEFVGSVSHDLREPLRAVRGYARMLQEDHGAELAPGARACVAKVLNAARQMERMIEDLLVLSRLGAQALPGSPVNTRQVVDRAVASVLAAPTGRVHLAIGELPDCHGHAGLLELAWTNLLSNALKFTRERERALIEVGGEESGWGVTYFVRDNGIGFDPDRAGDLFRPFRQLHDAQRFEGHGIGLATVQRIVRRHGGRVWAEATPGNGATFYFTISPEA